MKWGLGLISVACAALVLGVAIVAPTTQRERRALPAPGAQAQVGSSWTAVTMSRALVPVPVLEPEPGTEVDSGEPAEEPILSPTPRPDGTAEAPENAYRDPNTVSETSTVRD